MKKHALIPGLMLIACFAAMLLHARKISGTADEQDLVAVSLEGLYPVIGEKQHINLLPDHVKGEVFFYTRLALAPRHVELLRPEDAADTFLVISNQNAVDSPRKGHTLWAHSDRLFRYRLIAAE
jgi:hypothetical protein